YILKWRNGRASRLEHGCDFLRDLPLERDLPGIAVRHRLRGRRHLNGRDDITNPDDDPAGIRIPERLVAEIELKERGAGRRDFVDTRYELALRRQDASCRVA